MELILPQLTISDSLRVNSLNKQLSRLPESSELTQQEVHLHSEQQSKFDIMKILYAAQTGTRRLLGSQFGPDLLCWMVSWLWSDQGDGKVTRLRSYG